MRYPDYLMHFGIKGMKWGVRRFQNKDGSYTPLGLKRRFGGSGGSSSGNRGGSGRARGGSGSNAEARKAKIKKGLKIAAGVAGATALAYGTYKLAKSGKGRQLLDTARMRGSLAMQTARNSKLGQKVGNAAYNARVHAGNVADRIGNSKVVGTARLKGHLAAQSFKNSRFAQGAGRAADNARYNVSKAYNKVRGTAPVRGAVNTTLTGLGNAQRGLATARDTARLKGGLAKQAIRNSRFAQGASNAAYNARVRAGNVADRVRGSKPVRGAVNSTLRGLGNAQRKLGDARDAAWIHADDARKAVGRAARNARGSARRAGDTVSGTLRSVSRVSGLSGAIDTARMRGSLARQTVRNSKLGQGVSNRVYNAGVSARNLARNARDAASTAGARVGGTARAIKNVYGDDIRRAGAFAVGAAGGAYLGKKTKNYINNRFNTGSKSSRRKSSGRKRKR